MDVLVIVGDGEPPGQVGARAAHTIRVPARGPGPDAVAEIRGRIPREVAVWGAGPTAAVDAAAALHDAGFPVILYTDAPVTSALRGVEVRSAVDGGAPMAVADS